MSDFTSVERLNSLKQCIEAKTGETYTDLTGGVQALMDGFGQGGSGGGESDVIPVVASIMTIAPDYIDTPEELKLHFLTYCELTYRPDIEVIGKQIKIIGTFGRNGGVRFESFNTGIEVSAIKELDFGGASVECATIQTFRNCQHLERINAVMTVVPTNNKWDRDFLNCGKLVEIRYKENHISLSGIPMSTCYSLSDDSLISVANALVATTEGGKSWSLPATPKARCEEILGTVSQKTADDGTVYDFFTADSAGAVTLTEFITVTKGWTLA